jgi:hypothetical protein
MRRRNVSGALDLFLSVSILLFVILTASAAAGLVLSAIFNWVVLPAYRWSIT